MASSVENDSIDKEMKKVRINFENTTSDEELKEEGTDKDDDDLGFPDKYLTKGKYWFPGKDKLTEKEWNLLVYGEKALTDAENLPEKLGDEYDKYCLHIGQPFLPEYDMTPEQRKEYNEKMEWPKDMQSEKPDLAAALKPLALMKHAYGLENDPNAGDKIYERFNLRSDYTKEEKEKRRKIQQERHQIYDSWAEEILQTKPKPPDPTVPSVKEVQFFKEIHGMEWGRERSIPQIKITPPTPTAADMDL